MLSDLLRWSWFWWSGGRRHGKNWLVIAGYRCRCLHIYMTVVRARALYNYTGQCRSYGSGD